MSDLITANLKNQPPGMIVNFVLDESGSMRYVFEQTIQGFNTYVKERKSSPEAQRKGSVFFSLTKFSTRANVVYAAKEISEVEELDSQSYNPDGNTALMDAIGRTIVAVEESIKDWPTKPAILTVIMTDGQENASTDYRAEQIRKMIQDKEAEGNWTFVFLGADLNTMNVGQSYGIKSGNTRQYDVNNMHQVMDNLSIDTSRYAASASRGVMRTANFFDTSDANAFAEDDQK